MHFVAWPLLDYTNVLFEYVLVSVLVLLLLQHLFHPLSAVTEYKPTAMSPTVFGPPF